MSKAFEDLKTALNEAIAYTRGQGKAKVTTYIIPPVREFTNIEVRNIRQKAGMTQSAFASYMGVSKKTVEAWERGRTHPTGPACRLLDMLNNNDDIPFLKVAE